MITKRIIPCLDVRDGRVVKGVNFLGVRDVSDPVKLAQYYSESGADELVFYDITATVEGRALFTDILTRVAEHDLHSLDRRRRHPDPRRTLTASSNAARTRSASTPARIRDPVLIGQGAERYGNQCVVLSVDAKRVDGSLPRLFPRRPGGHRAWTPSSGSAGASAWAQVRSCSTPSTPTASSRALTWRCWTPSASVVNVPVIASGGAGCAADFVELFQALPQVDAGLAASIFHFGEVPIPALKRTLRRSRASNIRRIERHV